MIRKDQRPVKRIYKQAILNPSVDNRLAGFRMLRYIVRKATSTGRIPLSVEYIFFPYIDKYEGEGHRVVVDTIYLGKRKCLDHKLRRLFRKAHNPSASTLSWRA